MTAGGRTYNETYPLRLGVGINDLIRPYYDIEKPPHLPGIDTSNDPVIQANILTPSGKRAAISVLQYNSNVNTRLWAIEIYTEAENADINVRVDFPYYNFNYVSFIIPGATSAQDSYILYKKDEIGKPLFTTSTDERKKTIYVQAGASHSTLIVRGNQLSGITRMTSQEEVPKVLVDNNVVDKFYTETRGVYVYDVTGGTPTNCLLTGFPSSGSSPIINNGQGYFSNMTLNENPPRRILWLDGGVYETPNNLKECIIGKEVIVYTLPSNETAVYPVDGLFMGDMNGDGNVDMKDLRILKYGQDNTTPSEGGFGESYTISSNSDIWLNDLNADGRVSLHDLHIFKKAFGKKSPCYISP